MRVDGFYNPVTNLFTSRQCSDWKFRTTGHELQRAVERVCRIDKHDKYVCVHNQLVKAVILKHINNPVVSRLISYIYTANPTTLTIDQIKELAEKQYTPDVIREQRDRFVLGINTIGLQMLLDKRLLPPQDWLTKQFVYPERYRYLFYFKALQYASVVGTNQYDEESCNTLENLNLDKTCSGQQQIPCSDKRHYLAEITVMVNKPVVFKRDNQKNIDIDLNSLVEAPTGTTRQLQESALAQALHDKKLLLSEFFNLPDEIMYEHAGKDVVAFKLIEKDLNDEYKIKATLISDEADGSYTIYEMQLVNKTTGTTNPLTAIVI